MATIHETGEEWIVIPTPIVVPTEVPVEEPTVAPAVPTQLVPVGEATS